MKSLLLCIVAALLGSAAAFAPVRTSAAGRAVHPRAIPDAAAPRAPLVLGMKVVSSIGSMKKRSKTCQIVRRRGRVYLIDKKNPRNKVRQGGAKMKKRKFK